EKQGLSPILYRILSIQKDKENPSLQKMSQNIISTEFFSEFKLIKDIPVWNQMRENAFKIVEEEFPQTIIQKGLTKETHKQIIQNNHDDYIRFFQRKIRYLISDLANDERFEEHFIKFNEELKEEILLNIKSEEKNILDSQKLSDFLVTINNHLSLSFVKFFSRKAAVFLTSKEPYRQKILDYFNEFFQYLIVF
ncbi:MAG: hypothetical protein KAQ95_06075, partial [Candidatus Heimdallarchaeota archaeon]|nr:hypothetical protein [Candidatus Heimdallarchaeota archaeon]